MLWKKVKTAKVVIAPKAKKRKVTIAYNSDDSDEVREK